MKPQNPEPALPTWAQELSQHDQRLVLLAASLQSRTPDNFVAFSALMTARAIVTEETNRQAADTKVELELQQMQVHSSQLSQEQQRLEQLDNKKESTTPNTDEQQKETQDEEKTKAEITEEQP